MPTSLTADMPQRPVGLNMILSQQNLISVFPRKYIFSLSAWRGFWAYIYVNVNLYLKNGKFVDCIINQEHGIMQSRSTATQMLSYLDHIYSLRDNYVPVVAIYFDVNKAFDSVKHNYYWQNLRSMVLISIFWHLWIPICSTGDNVINSIPLFLRRFR